MNTINGNSIAVQTNRAEMLSGGNFTSPHKKMVTIGTTTTLDEPEERYSARKCAGASVCSPRRGEEKTP